MNNLRFIRWLLVLGVCCGLWPALRAAEPAPKKDAAAVLSEMRVKKWAKDLELTADQQKKVQALFDAEGGEFKKINDDENVSVADRRARQTAVQEKTYGQMKPLLTPAQLETFEKIRSKATKPKTVAPKKEAPPADK